MTTEIPSPDDIRKITDIDLLDEKYQAEWFEYVMKTISSLLTKKSYALQQDEVIRYDFPGRIFGSSDPNSKNYEPNRYERIWSKRYQEIVNLLVDKGYYCEANDFHQPVCLYISLREFSLLEGPDEPDEDFGYDESKSDNRPWWKKLFYT